MSDEISEYLKQVVLGDPGRAPRNRLGRLREHRMLRTPRRDVQIHVFSSGSGQIERHLLFRDHLCRVADDCRRYEGLKRELASQPWATMQHYAEAKTDLIEELLARARAEEGTA